MIRSECVACPVEGCCTETYRGPRCAALRDAAGVRTEPLTNADALCADLKNFASLDEEQQEAVADYIACPSSPGCEYDGGSDRSCCAPCKVKWLLGFWEG